jgi:hypothetical protein
MTTRTECNDGRTCPHEITHECPYCHVIVAHPQHDGSCITYQADRTCRYGVVACGRVKAHLLDRCTTPKRRRRAQNLEWTTLPLVARPD